MDKILGLYIFCSFIYLIHNQVITDANFKFLTKLDCLQNEYFNEITFQCVACKDGMVPKESKDSCVCGVGFKNDYSGNDTIAKCINCRGNNSNFGVSYDGKECVSCLRNNTVVPSNTDTGKCPLCLKDYFPEISIINGTLRQESCVDCRLSEFSFDSTICHNCLDGDCFVKSPEMSSEMKRQYSAVHSLDSSMKEYPNYYIQRSLFKTEYFCKKGNRNECHHLANLCVLQNYNLNKNTACSLYQAFLRLKMYDTIEHIPLIFSVANEASLELNRENAIESIFKFTENSNFSKLEIMANVFTLNGTYIGLHNIDELDIQLCPGLGQKLNKFKTFGSQYSHSCQLNLIDIKKMSANLFYELYLKYQKDDGTQSLYPIYLVNQGIYSNNQFINQNEERQQSWILTKRMYVLDTTVSHQINSTISLRYLSSFKLHITFQPGEGGKILPPYAVIKHSEVGILDETTILQHSFVVSYSNDDFVNEKGLEIAFAFFFCLTVLYSVVQAYSWGKRSGKSVAEISTMIQFIFIECNILSNVILAIVAAVAIGLTISYKKQQSIVFMLTLDDNNINLKRYIIFAFVLKTIALMHRLGQLVLAETFFIDWEKNKVQTSMAINEHILSEPRPMASHEPLNNLNKSKSDSKTVGIWRTYFVANEWNELQCYRKTNIGIQVFLVVILFEYFQFKNYAKIEPQFDRKSDTLDYIYESNLTRFAILTVIYFVVNLCQWITRSFILEPIEDPFRNFVDLCSIANISIITLTHALHGYYIHGRSPHGYADTNMGEINKFLQMEKNNQSGYRGIDGQNDLQTYIFTFPNTFRDKWNRVMNTLREVTVAQSKSRNNNAVTTKIDNNVKIYEDLNNFLKTVISHGDFGCDYEITTPKVFEDFLDVELADTTLKGLLYKDESEVAYTQVFVYGNEFILVTFEFLFFIISDFIFTDVLISAFLTFCLSKLIQAITSYLFTLHLIKSSLIDHRFFI